MDEWFTLWATAIDGWRMKTASVSSSAGWAEPYISEYSSATYLTTVGPEAFSATLSGELIPPPGPGSGPIDYSVKGDLSGSLEIDPTEDEATKTKNATFKALINSIGANAAWTITPLEGGTSVSQPEKSDSISIGMDYEPGRYEVKATANAESKTATLKVIGLDSEVTGDEIICWGDEGSFVATEVPSGEDTSEIKWTASKDGTFTPESGDKTVKWKPGYDTCSTTDNDITITAELKGSKGTAKTTVVDVEDIDGPNVVAVDELAIYYFWTKPDLHYDKTKISGDCTVLTTNTEMGFTIVVFSSPSSGSNDKKNIVFELTNELSKISYGILVAKVVEVWPSNEVVAAGSSTGIFANSNLNDGDTWPVSDNWPKWKVSGAGSGNLENWKGSDSNIYTFSNPGTYTFTAECGNTQAECSVTAVKVDIQMQGLGEDKENSEGAFVVLNDKVETGVLNNNLVSASLIVNADGLPGGYSGTVRLNKSANIRLWADSAMNEEITELQWDLGSQPSSVYVEGTNPSGSVRGDGLSLVLHVTNGEKSAQVSDSVSITVCSVAMKLEGLAQDEKLDPGAFIQINSDDDNQNGAVDKNETGEVSNEDDLVKLTIEERPSGLFGALKAAQKGSLTLVRDGGPASGYVTFWKNSTRGEKITDLSWSFSDEETEVPDSMYVEGSSRSGQMKDLALKLYFHCGVAATKDELNITVFDVDLSMQELDENREEKVGAFVALNGEKATPTSNNLVPVNLTVMPGRLADGYTGTVKLEKTANLKLWADSSMSSEVTETEWDLGSQPEVLYVEGTKASDSVRGDSLTLTVDLKKDGNTFISIYDVVKITVFNFELEVTNLAESKKLEPGAIVVLNNDDDDKDGKIDNLDDNGVNDEDDLLKAQMKASPSGVVAGLHQLGRGQLALNKIQLSGTNGSNVNFWKEKNKNNKMGTNWNFNVDEDIANDGVFYIEGTVQSYKLKDVILNLEFSGLGVLKDTVNVTIFQKADLDLTGLPEDKEEVPGGIVFVNCDDDNKNTIPDMDEKGADPDIVPLKLTLKEPKLTTGYTVEIKLHVDDNLTNIWTDTARTTKLDVFRWDAAAKVPPMLYVEGATPGKTNYTLEHIIRKGDEIIFVSTDIINITVAKVNLIVDNVPEDKEEKPGVMVKYNGDNDDEDAYVDRSDNDGVAKENELLTVKITAEPSLGEVEKVLKGLGTGKIYITEKHVNSVFNGDVRFWKDNEKKEAYTSLLWDFSNPATNPPDSDKAIVPDKIYMEGITVSGNANDIILTLFATAPVGSTSDVANLTVLEADMTIVECAENGAKSISEVEEESVGAYIPLNEDYDGKLTDKDGNLLPDNSDDKINGSVDQRDVATLTLWQIAINNMPNGYKVDLYKAEGDGHIKIFEDADTLLIDTSIKPQSGDEPDQNASTVSNRLTEAQQKALYTSLISGNVTYYVEGTVAGTIKLRMDIIDTDGKVVANDVIRLNVSRPFGLTVDSNNDGSINALDEAVEEQAPGAVISVNNSDKDMDMIPDYADGFSCWDEVNEDANSYKTNTGALGSDFKKMKFSIPDFVNIEKTKIRFIYSSSVPQAKTAENPVGDITRSVFTNNRILISTGKPENIFKYTLEGGYLRIWTKDESEQRNGKYLTLDGDFVPSYLKDDTKTEVPASKFGFEAGITEKTLYIEAVKGLADIKGLNINVEIIETMANGKTRTFKDMVKVMPLDPEMLVDGNRDNALTRGDVRDKNIEFWVNNDEDVRHETNATDNLTSIISYWAEDDAAGTTPNNSDNIINCMRDLEDFNRIQFKNIAPIINLRDTYGITVKCGIGKKGFFSDAPIRLFESFENSATTDYVTNAKANIGAQQLNMSALSNLHWGDKPLEVFNDKNYIFEGINPGKSQVVFEVCINNVVVRDIVNMDLRDPSYFCTRQNDELKYTDEKDLIVYVNGMNMDDYTFRRWTETVYKRLWWLGYKGRVCGFFWENYGFDSFNASELMAWQSSDALSAFLQSMKGKYNINGASRVNVIAHSQGNIITGEAINKAPIGTVKTYMPMQAAISGHVYGKFSDSRCEFKLDTTIPDFYRYYSSGATPAQPYLIKNIELVKTKINCFNYNDYALDWWKTSNSLKPNFLLGYGYSRSIKRFSRWTTDLYFPDNRYEIFSYAAPSWSHALGTGAISVMSRNINMATAYSFDPASSHLYHSWQFRETNHVTRFFWNTVKSSCLND